MRKIGVLCSGGDCQGMNACIKAIVDTCTSNEIEVLGINRGYQGLIENDIRPLTRLEVANIETIAGALIKTSRSADFMTEPGFKKAIDNLKLNGIEGLIVIGGNGSFRGARDLVNAGVHVIGIPGTIDNDLFYTERALGFDTAVQQAVNTVTDIKQTMYANNRASVFKCMGRPKRMIRENEYNFTEISEKLGFNTPQYFTTVFRRLSGMSPSEYAHSVKSKFAKE